MIISPDDIQIVGDGVFRSRPYDLQNLVIANGARDATRRERYVVDGGAAIGTSATGRKSGNEISRNIRKGGLRVTGWCELNPFVAAIEIQGSVGIFGKRHHAGIVGDRSGKELRREWCGGQAVGVGRIPGQ